MALNPKVGVRRGDRVRYESAAGTIRGEVHNIDLAENAAGQLIPWIHIEHCVKNKYVVTRIAGTEENLRMMKFQVNFRGVLEMAAA